MVFTSGMAMAVLAIQAGLLLILFAQITRDRVLRAHQTRACIKLSNYALLSELRIPGRCDMPRFLACLPV